MPGCSSLCKPNGTEVFGYSGFVMSLSVLKGKVLKRDLKKDGVICDIVHWLLGQTQLYWHMESH